MMDAFRQSLIDYVLSGHAYLHAHTPEKTRFVQELKEVAAELPPDGRPIFVWSPATGWQDVEGKPAKTESGAELGQPNPQMAPQQILELPEESLFVLKDFGCYLQSRTFAYFDIVLAWLSEIRDVLAHTGRTVIFVGVDFEIPPVLQHDVTTIEFKLPNDAAIEQAIRYVGEDHPIDEAFMPALVTACRGMTQQGPWQDVAGHPPQDRALPRHEYLQRRRHGGAAVEYFRRFTRHLRENYGLQFVGPWHSHHRLALNKPSRGDDETTKSLSRRNNLNRLVEILINHEAPPVASTGLWGLGGAGRVGASKTADRIGWRGTKSEPGRDALVRVNSFHHDNPQVADYRRCQLSMLPGISPIRLKMITQGLVDGSFQLHSQISFPMSRIRFDSADPPAARSKTGDPELEVPATLAAQLADSITLNKRYQDQDSGDWKDSSSFFPDDLPRLRLLLDKAYEHLVLRDVSPTADGAGVPPEHVAAG